MGFPQIIHKKQHSDKKSDRPNAYLAGFSTYWQEICYQQIPVQQAFSGN